MNYKIVNAFQMKQEDYKEVEDCIKEFKYYHWIPERIAMIGYIFVFYNNRNDLKKFTGYLDYIDEDRPSEDIYKNELISAEDALDKYLDLEDE